MTETNTDNGKTIGIIAYLSLIGWIIAFVMHSSNKTEQGAYHIRQMLGLMILYAIAWVIGFGIALVLGTGFVSWILLIGVFVLWLLSFLGALQGEKKPTLLLGAQFQEWFKGIG